MNKHYLFSALLLINFLITGCSPSEKESPITTKQAYTNTQILLQSFEYYNTFNTADVVSAEIWNMTENFIEFPNNFNIRIFERTRKGWVEIFEKPVTRLPPGDFVFNPVDGSSYVEMVGVFPDLPELDRKYDLRIYVSGQMQENGEIIEVFAFTDITLRP